LNYGFPVEGAGILTDSALSQWRHGLCTRVLRLLGAARMGHILSGIKRYEMSVISKEQLKQDERSLVIFLVLFNIALISAFLLICRYQG